MVFASWGPDYSVGVAELDAQHRNLFDLVKDFDDCIRRGLARESIARVIDALIQYSRYHFSYEEKLMKKYHELKAKAEDLAKEKATEE